MITKQIFLHWISLAVLGFLFGCSLLSLGCTRISTEAIKTKDLATFEPNLIIHLYVDGMIYECALPEELRDLATVKWGGAPLSKYVLASAEGASFFMLDAGIAQFWMYCYQGYACDGDCAVQLIRMPTIEIYNGEPYPAFKWWLHSFARDGVAKIDRITQEQAEWWIRLLKNESYDMLPQDMIQRNL